MSLQNRSLFPKHLAPSLYKFFDTYSGNYKPVVDKVFKTVMSDRAWEEDVLLTGMAAAQIKYEGAQSKADELIEAYSKTYTHIAVAIQYAFTEELVEDNQYQPLAKKAAEASALSMMHAKEIYHAAVLNNSVDTNYAGGDGKPLLATDHPLVRAIGVQTQSNKLSIAADLSETALENIIIQIRKTKDDRGKASPVAPRQLLVPPELEFTAKKILGTPKELGTFHNDINIINTEDLIPGGTIVWPYLTDTNAWYVITDATDGLKSYSRIKLARKAWEDFGAGVFRFACRERYSAGFTDWRGVFGSEGSGS